MSFLTSSQQATDLGVVKPSWESVAAKVRARIDNAIPPSYLVDPLLLPKTLNEPILDLPAKSGILTAREVEITELNAYELVPKLADQTYTSVEVTLAFCKRAAIAHQVVSSLYKESNMWEEANIRSRRTVLHSYCSTTLCNEQKSLTSIWRELGSRLDHFTGSPFL